jgi:flagellar protein FliO/FliZ
MKNAMASKLLLVGLLLAGGVAGAASAPATAGGASAPAATAAAATAAAATAAAASSSTTAASATTVATAAVATASAPVASRDAMSGMYGNASTSGSGVGHMVQVLGALIFVIMLMLGLAWFLKNHGPRSLMGRVPVKVVGGVSLGGRERILVIEVADSWLVIGSTPSQITPIATLPRQPMPEDEPVPGKQFSIWLKQIMEKRNG